MMHLFWVKNFSFTEDVISKLIADARDLLEENSSATSDGDALHYRAVKASPNAPGISPPGSERLLSCIQTILYSLTFGLYYKSAGEDPGTDRDSLLCLHKKLCKDVFNIVYTTLLEDLDPIKIKKGTAK